MKTTASKQLLGLSAPLVAVLMLSGIGYYNSTLPTPDDVTEYHRKIAELVTEIPREIEADGQHWIGKDSPVQPAAIQILKPNIIISRQYIDQNNDSRGFGLLLVHCRDARDMQGHYPPVCYPNNGMKEIERNKITFPLMGKDVAGMEYLFRQELPGQIHDKWVINLILLPDGTFARTNGELIKQAADYLNRFYGAAQVQFTFDKNLRMQWEEHEREEVIEFFAHYLEPVLLSIGSSKRFEIDGDLDGVIEDYWEQRGGTEPQSPDNSDSPDSPDGPDIDQNSDVLETGMSTSLEVNGISSDLLSGHQVESIAEPMLFKMSWLSLETTSLSIEELSYSTILRNFSPKATDVRGEMLDFFTFNYQLFDQYHETPMSSQDGGREDEFVSLSSLRLVREFDHDDNA